MRLISTVFLNLLCVMVVIAQEPPIYELPPIELVPSEMGLAADAQKVDWGHGPLEATEAHTHTRGRLAIVAILDTGIDSTHPDLEGCVIHAENFTNSATVLDIQGHGTHCAGIVAARDNQTGSKGIAPECRLVNMKVLGDNGSGSANGIVRAINRCVELKESGRVDIDVISMSLGSPSPYPPQEIAIKRAREAGIIVVAAAGNDGRDNSVNYPGKYGALLCVGAHDSRLMVSSFSSRGPEVDLSAPGTGIFSLYPSNRTAVLSGTSMATPYAAGVAALYVSYCKEKDLKPTIQNFDKILKDVGTITQNPVRPNPASGWGRLIASKFVGWTTGVDPDPVPDPTPDPEPIPDPTPTPEPTSFRIRESDLIESKRGEFKLIFGEDATFELRIMPGHQKQPDIPQQRIPSSKIPS